MFNSASTIDKCVNSILTQTYYNIELIIIDDGSVDDSYARSLAFSKKDKRVLLLKNNSKGVSSARNLGLKTATGSFIMFVDSDDYIENDTVEKALHLIEKGSDIAIWGYVFEENNKTSKHIIGEDFFNVSEYDFVNRYFLKLLSNYSINNIGTKLYKKGIIDLNGLAFGNNNICEDIGFAIDYLSCCKTISYCDACLYHYVNNSSGLMHKNKPNYIEAKKELLKKLSSYVEKNKLQDFNEFHAYVFKNIRALLIDAYRYSDDVEGDFQAIFNDEYYKSFIIEYKNNRNVPFKDKLFCGSFLKKRSLLIKLSIKFFCRGI